MVQFERPIGAVADVKELEYISALHQTADQTRRDGSIQAQDIKFYLKSRFGVNVTEKEVCEQILQGMGGGSDDAEVIDLMELTAILLIPVLLKANMDLRGDDLPENVAAPPPNLIEFVYQMILHDTVGQSDPTPTLTVDLLQRIFKTYGEDELAADEELLEKMIAQAGVADEEGNSKFDVSAFATAITEDVTLFNIENENMPSSVYYDAIEGDPGPLKRVNRSDDAVIEDDPTDPLEISKASAEPAIKDTPPFHDRNENQSSSRSSSRSSTLYYDTGEVESFHDADEVESDPIHRASSVSIEASEVKHSAIEMSKDVDGALFEDEPQLFEDKPTKSLEISRSFTAPAIDSTVGAYRSTMLLVNLWAIVIVAVYLYLIPAMDQQLAAGYHKYCPESDKYAWGTEGSGWSANSGFFSSMLCGASETTVEWLVRYVSFCISGMGYMGLASIGNTETAKKPLRPFLGFFFTAVVIQTIVSNNEKVDWITVFLIMLVCACLTAHLLHIVYLCLSEDSGLKHRLRKHAMKSEMDLKSAMSYKLNNMAANACELHRRKNTQKALGTCFSKGIYAFSKSPETDVETSGGFLWGWKLIWSRDVVKKEGIPYSARMIASNIAQFIIMMGIFSIAIWILPKIKDLFGREEHRQNLKQYISYLFNDVLTEENARAFSVDISTRVVSFLALLNSTAAIDINCEERNVTAEDLCAILDLENMSTDDQMSLLDAAGFPVGEILDETRQTLNSAVDTAVNSLFPEELYMVMVPLSFGFICATLTAAWLGLGYLPSVTSTYIQLRTGVIPTLKDDLFNQYRVQLDTVTMITGSIFFGCFYSTIVVFLIVALLVFLFVWQGTVFLAQRFVVLGISAIVISIIRTGISMTVRTRFFQNFYRTRPAAANIIFLCLEWANFVLSAAFLFVRMAKLTVATGMSVGRIDTPIFAKGAANIGPVNLDAYPIVHLRDILSREAHRHPYIEMLGTVYLMKLRYGKAFGTNAGSCWRLLFVYALMPWLQQYRIFTDDAITEELLEVQDTSDDDENEKSIPLLLPEVHATINTTNKENVERIRELEGEIQRLRAALGDTAAPNTQY